MSIVSVQDLELFLGKTIQGTTSEDKYEFLITAVQEEAETITNRKFDITDYTEVYDGNGSSELFLNQYPVQSVSAVYYGWIWGTVEGTEIADADYRVYNEEGCLTFGFYSIDDGKQVFQVTYSAGYSDESDSSYPIPQDLKKIIMEEIEGNYQTTYADLNLKKEKLGDYTYERFDRSTTNEITISSFTQKLTKWIKADI